MSARGEKKSAFIPVKFKVTEAGEPGKTSKAVEKDAGKEKRGLRLLEYKGGGIGKHPEAKGWIFGGRNCAGCNFLKGELLPKLIEKEGLEKAVVVVVDTDVKENFMLMVELEEKLGVSGNKSPVLYWKNKMYYGNDAVRELIGEGK